MSFYSELTKAGYMTNRHVRRKIKHAEAVERNARTKPERTKAFRRAAEVRRRSAR